MSAGASAQTFPTWLSTCAIWLLSSVGYIVVAWFELVRPIAGQWSDALLGTSLFRPDPILNAGILEWGYQAIRTAPLRFFDWPAGFPIVNSLAGTENLIGWQLFYTPLRLLGVGNVAAVNTLLVAAVVLSAMTMMLLARQLGLNPWAAFVAGLVFAFVPFHISQLIQIQSLSIAWVPLTLVFLERALGRPTLPPLLALTLSIVMTVLSGMYIGIFLLLVLPLYVGTTLLVRHRHIGRTTLLRIVASLALALVLVSPMVFVYARFAATEGGYYHAASQMVGEALADFLRPAQWQTLWSGAPISSGSFITAAFPGVVTMALALVGVLRARHSPVVRMALILGACTALLALGPTLKLTDDQTISIAGHNLPAPGAIFVLASAIRYPMRLTLFTFLFGALLAGVGLHQLMQHRGRGQRVLLAALAIVLIAIEYRPDSALAGASMRLPAPNDLSQAYVALAQETDRGAIVELPLTDNQRTGDATYMALDIYAAASHQRRTVSYYGGVRPPQLDTYQSAAALLPDEDARRVLLATGISRLVVHTAWMPTPEATQLVEKLDSAGYPRIFTAADAVVYSLSVSGP